MDEEQRVAVVCPKCPSDLPPILPVKNLVTNILSGVIIVFGTLLFWYLGFFVLRYFGNLYPMYTIHWIKKLYSNPAAA